MSEPKMCGAREVVIYIQLSGSSVHPKIPVVQGSSAGSS
jgi:hypothetical protein